MQNSRPLAGFYRHYRRRFAAVACGVVLSLVSAAQAGVIAHWTFDVPPNPDKKDFDDSVTTNPHPAVPNPTMDYRYFGDAPFGSALKLGPGSYLKVSGINGFQKNNFTVAAWVYVNEPGRHFVLGDWTNPNYSFLFGVDQQPANSGKNYISGELRSIDRDASGRTLTPVVRVTSLKAGKEVPSKQWHHVAWVWKKSDGTHGTMTLYLDGKEAGSMSSVPGKVSAVQDNPKNVAVIGHKQDSKSDYNGTLDELWVFNEALPPDQINNLMRNNNITGKGPLAKMFQKDEPEDATANVPANTVATAAPAAPPAARSAPTTPTPAPVTANATPAAPSTPTPAVAVTPTPTPPPTVTPGPAMAAAPVTPSTPPEAAPPVVARAPEVAPPPAAVNNPAERIVAVNTPRAPMTATPAVLLPPRGYSPLRIAGIITTSSIAIFLASFLMWAFNERAKMQGSRRN